jgi:hypothetical protein
MSAKIYKCDLVFKYTKYYISVILIADDHNDAKNKFISKCLEKYDEITRIDFEMFYYKNEAYDEPPVNFNNISDFKKYLFENINEDTIECLETSKFEIKDKYED